MIDTITLDNASGILDVFNDFNCRDLLTGEMSWKFQNYIKFSIENCLEIFLIAYKYDLAVLKINALYFIKDNWNEIKDSEKFNKITDAQCDGISLIEQYVGYNYPKNLLIIPYKITLTRKQSEEFFGFHFVHFRNSEWKR